MRLSRKYCALCFSLFSCLLFLQTQNVHGQTAPTATANFQRPEQPQLVAQLGHSNGIRCIAFSPNGRYVLTGSRDKTARLWDLETGLEFRKFEGHKDDIFSVAFSPDGLHALTGSIDNTARLWDLETGL